MDEKKYLLNQIKKCRRKMNLAKCIDSGIFFAAAGGMGGILCELLSFFVPWNALLPWNAFLPFYHVHLAAGLCFAAGLLAGIGYAVYRRAGMEQAARMLDSFGLEERMVTAYEQIMEEERSMEGGRSMEEERSMEEKRSMEGGRSMEGECSMEKAHSAGAPYFGGNMLIQLQRQDALSQYERMRGQIRIPLFPEKRHVLALLLSAAAVTAMAFIPSPVRRQAEIIHQVREQAGEELEELENLLDALEEVDMDSLTEEERLQLQEITEALQLSREELSGADSWESLASAMDRLDYKYGQTAQGLEKLGAQLDDSGKAGIAAAEAVARAAANPDGRQMASGGTPGAGSSAGKDGDGGSGEGNGSGEGDGNSQGSSSGNRNGQDSDSGQGNGDGQGSGSGNGNGQGGGSGEGNGDGQGGGSGEGNGDGQGGGSGEGNGNGQGSGSGNGRGTGSSDASHDYVSIPNAVGDDSNLTGTQYGDQDSEYFRQQNGLAWEGEHVEYSSVIGEYTESAYEGLANGRYPSGMESVIRDYFGSLNQ